MESRRADQMDGCGLEVAAEAALRDPSPIWPAGPWGGVPGVHDTQHPGPDPRHVLRAVSDHAPVPLWEGVQCQGGPIAHRPVPVPRHHLPPDQLLDLCARDGDRGCPGFLRPRPGRLVRPRT